jgi:hypothetical protein
MARRIDFGPIRGGATPLLALAGVAAPVIVRISWLADLSGRTAVDARGFASDIGTGLVIAALIALVAKASFWVALLGAATWGVLNYANLEHLSELGGLLQPTFAKYLGDPTFIIGSAMAITRPAIFLGLLVATLGPTWWALRSARSPARISTLAALGLALLGLHHVTGWDDQSLTARQRNFLHHTLANAASGAVVDAAGLAFAVRPPELAANLEGEARLPLPGSARNVILLVLEGLPASVLAELSRDDEIERPLVMPRLSALAEQNIVASNFLLHQRQTNRGLYSLLCGDYPKLDASMAKMATYASDPSRDCLPRLLGAAGYHSVFLQGAPLAFMYKDVFAEAAGFDEVLGNRDFEDPIHRSQWGVDDRTLLRDAKRIVDRLAEQETPWLLTVLSVGTHHPSVIPGDLSNDSTRSGFEAAIPYLDDALGDFVDALERDGQLRDTLLVVTSDESRGAGEIDDVHNQLGRSWGPLVIVTPERQRFLISAPYGQSDITLSLLDYLGLWQSSGSRDEPIGRSLFRDYAEARRLYFGNVFIERTGGVDGAGEAFICDAEAVRCTVYSAPDGRLFRPPRTAATTRAMDADELARVQQVIAYSRSGSDRYERAFTLPLMGEDTVRVLGNGPQLIMDGQNVDVPPFSLVDVDISLVLESRPGGALDMRFEFGEKGYSEFLTRSLGPLQSGDEVVIRFGFATTKRTMRNVHFRLIASQQEGPQFEIRIERAALGVRPLEEQVERPGFIDKPRFEIQRPSAARGAELYEEHRCAGCHEYVSVPGQKLVKLDGLLERHTTGSLERLLAAPMPPMPEFPLDDRQRRSLALHLLERFR